MSRARILKLCAVIGASLAASAPALAVAPGLRSVDWKTVTLPGSVCGASQPIELRGGSATVVSSRWPHFHKVEVSIEQQVVYGDLDRDGVDEAALGVICSNAGGTAAGQLAVAQVIFKLYGSGPGVLGIVTPRGKVAPGEHPPLLTVQLEPGRVVATEYVYGPQDGDCCPSGRTRTIWKLESGKLVPGRPVVLRKPA